MTTPMPTNPTDEEIERLESYVAGRGASDIEVSGSFILRMCAAARDRNRLERALRDIASGDCETEHDPDPRFQAYGVTPEPNWPGVGGQLLRAEVKSAPSACKRCGEDCEVRYPDGHEPPRMLCGDCSDRALRQRLGRPIEAAPRCAVQCWYYGHFAQCTRKPDHAGGHLYWLDDYAARAVEGKGS